MWRFGEGNWEGENGFENRPPPQPRDNSDTGSDQDDRSQLGLETYFYFL